MDPNALEVNDQLFHVLSYLSLFINPSGTLKMAYFDLVNELIK